MAGGELGSAYMRAAWQDETELCEAIAIKAREIRDREGEEQAKRIANAVGKMLDG